MESAYVDAQDDDQQNDDALHNLSNTRKLGGAGLDCSELKSKKLARRQNPLHPLVFSGKRQQTAKLFSTDLLHLSTFVLESKIPKCVVTLDEKYLRRCLELIHISAVKAAKYNISSNLCSVEKFFLPGSVESAGFWIEKSCDLGQLDFECPLTTGTGTVVASPAGRWVLGSIMGSKSMVNILNSPLLQKLGSLDADVKSRRTNLSNVTGSPCTNFMSSPSGLSNYMPEKPKKDTITSENRKNQSENVHKRLVSMSSTTSTCSDQSFSSSSTTISQAMLQCTWNGGMPHFVFSLDDQKEVYVADLLEKRPANDMGLDSMYMFHMTKGTHKEHEIYDSKSQLVGKMKVSTSFTICPKNSKLMETEFVLYSQSENFIGEMQTSNHNHRKNKGQLKKVVEVFRNSHSTKQRTMSRFGGSSSILENISWEPSQDTAKNSDALSGINLLENYLPANLELAAIVAKDHLPVNQRQEVGGWGLKFLKKVGLNQTTEVREDTSPCSSCCCKDGDCSTEMNVLVPAGLHGGPRTRNGGPSSLIERWKTGGHCDCGGWDLGCPLTILKTRSSKEEVFPKADVSEVCKLFDFFVQGSENGTPTLRIANIHDGLYFVQFQSKLSALQSFSIAIAYVHTQSSAFRLKDVQEMK